ncbi:MAG: gliding motility protein GldM [Sphingobacteriales bacterium]|nr:gliding motility protein GldM [Sphingobacteriales bacterium]
MSLPKEPRQKMINIMYLVLTALLALNVSSEILNAFKTVNNSLVTSNIATNASTAQVFQSLTDKLKEPGAAEKAAIWRPIANDIMSYASKANNMIEQMKTDLMLEAGGSKSDPSKDYKIDNLDAATRLFVKKGKGKELLQLLTDFKNTVLKRDTAIGNAFANSLPINLDKPASQTGNNKKNWEESYFHMVPTIAALTILSKFQNDIKVSENKVVTFCHEQVGKVKIQQDAFAAIAVANATYVQPGQEIEVTAGVGGFSTAVQPQISINGQGIPIDPADGAAHYKFRPDGLGTRSITVNISYTDQNGKVISVPKTIPYTVGQSNTSIGLPEMNVLYVGWDNKVKIAASGAGDDRVSASIQCGTIAKQGGGMYIAKVTGQSDDCVVNILVDGKVVGSQSFRVRNIPDPVATVGGIMSNENMTAGQFKAQSGVGAFIKDFPLKLQYTVTSFTLTADDENGDIQEAPCTGNTWSPKALSVIRGLAPGRTVTIDNIRAVGPDGKNRKIPGLVYYIK